MYLDQLSYLLFRKKKNHKDYYSYRINIFPKIDEEKIDLLINKLEKRINRYRIYKINIPKEFLLDFCYRICPIKYYYPNYFKNNYLLSKYEISKIPDFYYDQFLIYYKRNKLNITNLLIK